MLIPFSYGLKMVRLTIALVYCQGEGPAGSGTFPADSVGLQWAIGRKFLKVVLIPEVWIRFPHAKETTNTFLSCQALPEISSKEEMHNYFQFSFSCSDGPTISLAFSFNTTNNLENPREICSVILWDLHFSQLQRAGTGEQRMSASTLSLATRIAYIQRVQYFFSVIAIQSQS